MSRSDGKPIFNDDLALMADEVSASRADAVSCIVDAGTAGLGRKIDSLRTIARQSGTFIVAGGGLHGRSDYPAGANLGRVVIGHLNDIERDIASTAIAIAKRGANLGFDHSGKPDDPRLDEYARAILAGARSGPRRPGLLVLGIQQLEVFANERRSRLWDDAHDVRAATPARGRSEATVRRILVDNRDVCSRLCRNQHERWHREALPHMARRHWPTSFQSIRFRFCCTS